MTEDLLITELQTNTESQCHMKKLEDELASGKPVDDLLCSVRLELDQEINRRKSELDQLKQDYESQLEEKTAFCRKIQKSEIRYRQMFNHIPDFSFCLDTNFYLLNVSSNVKNFLGYTSQELIGKRFTSLKCITEKSRDRAVAHLMRLFSEEQLPAAIFTFVDKDGSHKMGELNGSPIFEEGEQSLLVCSVRDVSARGQIDKEEFQKKLMEKDMEMAWSVYAGLKQPLASIANQADLILARIDENHPAHYLAGSLRGQLETLAQILLQISEISALEFGTV